MAEVVRTPEKPPLKPTPPESPQAPKKGLKQRFKDFDPMKMSKKKLIATAATAVAITGGAVGYQATQGSESEKPAAVSQPQPKETTPPTEAPKAIGHYEQTAEGIVFHTETGEILNVPQIQGLTAVMEKDPATQADEVRYKALRENPYGLTESAEAGMFKPNVTISENDVKKQVGGLTLDPRVVQKILQDRLAQIPNVRDRWLIPLPVDISSLPDTNPVSMRFTVGLDVPFVEVNFPETLPLINIIDTTQLRIAQTEPTAEKFGEWVYMDMSRLVGGDVNRIPPGKEMKYLLVVGNFSDFTENKTIDTKFGEKVSGVSKLLNVSVSAIEESFPVTPDKLLSIGQTPIFVAEKK